MLPKALRRVREIDDKDVIFDAKPKTPQEAVEEMHGDMRDMPQRSMIDLDASPYDEALKEFRRTQPPTLPPLEEIQRLVRTMPYGDVVAMAEGIGADPAKLWGWATK